MEKGTHFRNERARSTPETYINKIRFTRGETEPERNLDFSPINKELQPRENDSQRRDFIENDQMDRLDLDQQNLIRRIADATSTVEEKQSREYYRLMTRQQEASSAANSGINRQNSNLTSALTGGGHYLRPKRLRHSRNHSFLSKANLSLHDKRMSSKFVLPYSQEVLERGMTDNNPSDGQTIGTGTQINEKQQLKVNQNVSQHKSSPTRDPYTAQSQQIGIQPLGKDEQSQEQSNAQKIGSKDISTNSKLKEEEKEKTGSQSKGLLAQSPNLTFESFSMNVAKRLANQSGQLNREQESKNESEEKEQKLRELSKDNIKRGSKESNLLSLFGKENVLQRRETFLNKRIGSRSIEDARRKSSIIADPGTKFDKLSLFQKFPVLKALFESNFQEKRKKELLLEFLKKQEDLKSKHYNKMMSQLRAGFQLLFEQKQYFNQITYWLLDCNKAEFQVQFTKIYMLLTPMKNGGLNLETFEAWLRIFIQKTNVFIVAKLFNYFDSEVVEIDTDKYYFLQKIHNTKSESLETQFIDHIFRDLSKGRVFVPFRNIIVNFMLYFLLGMLLKIQRRKRLYESICYGDPDMNDRGINTMCSRKLGKEAYISQIDLQFIILEFYKTKIELTNNDLYKIMCAIKKSIQAKQLDFEPVEKKIYFGNESQPNMRHLSTWLPFTITLQVIANELDQCDNQEICLSGQ